MAAPTINFAGFVYDDSGDAVSGATIHIYDKNTTTTAREASSVTTNSSSDVLKLSAIKLTRNEQLDNLSYRTISFGFVLEIFAFLLIR